MVRFHTFSKQADVPRIYHNACDSTKRSDRTKYVISDKLNTNKCTSFHYISQFSLRCQEFGVG